jgi:ribosome biogenesis GTPase
VARRKGKSRRRIKNLQQRLLAGENLEDAAGPRQRLTQRKVKLPPQRLAAPDQFGKHLEDLPKVEGMVVGHFPGGVIVRAEADRRELLCGVAKTFRAPPATSALAVGDTVTAAVMPAAPAPGPGEAGAPPDGSRGPARLADDRDRADGMVLSRRPRRTALSRPQPRSGKRLDPYGPEVFEKVIVANVDVLLVVASTRQPPLRRGLIDRYLIIAERGELAAVLVINKIDLAAPDAQVLAEIAELGVATHLCSARTGEGLDALAAAVRQKRSVVAGASGAGKSTLINALVPGADAATRAVRMRDQRGRHRTTAAAVYDLPGGGTIVDTPGIRELGIHLGAAELPWYFAEFEPLAARCRFRNCTHTHEPDCAVRAAVEAGQILPRRYHSYLRILESLKP